MMKKIMTTLSLLAILTACGQVYSGKSKTSSQAGFGGNPNTRHPMFPPTHKLRDGLPSEVTLTAKMMAPLEIQVVAEDPTTLLTLDGKLKIQTITPELKNSLK